jgi:hypothetical protein
LCLHNGRKGIILIRINHYIVNTNQSSVVYPDKLNFNKYLQLNEVLKQAQNKAGIGLENDINFKLSRKEDYYIGKMSLNYKTNQIPLLITAGIISKQRHKEVWQEILWMRDMLFPLHDGMLKPPVPPYIVDMVSPSLYKNLDIYDWVEDFTKCAGWLLLSPSL